MTKLAAATHSSPFGMLYLIAEDDLLLAAGFRSLDELQARLPMGLSQRGFHKVAKISEVSEVWRSYCDGDIKGLSRVKWEQAGGPFRQKAWKAMTKIPAGKTISYADLALKSGSPSAMRAAGTACATNLIAPFIPCHRIVRTGGALGGYGYGLPTKIALLTFEGAI
ncbi:MAG: methylated-DNA--[protein]-cysteine S-methyltransferase [Actinobacteria bacterium]|nr:methylated-DNA--[protein]-cysteine S-methyltransferase [Actinomycetota bacterium]